MSYYYCGYVCFFISNGDVGALKFNICLIKRNHAYFAYTFVFISFTVYYCFKL
uniref:Uncharacterized protein n=1 Tax=Arundo donax TaxID=35708 RepID=A0A0A9FZW6_ARUDO